MSVMQFLDDSKFWVRAVRLAFSIGLIVAANFLGPLLTVSNPWIVIFVVATCLFCGINLLIELEMWRARRRIRKN